MSSIAPPNARPAAAGARLPAQRCVVCATPLPVVRTGVPDAADYPCCHAVACRMVVGRRTEMGETNFRHYLAMEVRKREYLAARAAALAAREQAEAVENGRAWDALQALLPANVPALRLVLPTGPRRSVSPSRERRARYRQHLLRVIAEARGMPAGASPGLAAAAESGGAGLAGRLCAFCGGGCCTMGGEQAYLGAATMRRFMDAHPGCSDEEVLSAYLGRVAPRTRIGACINQTRTGCSLPRELRSDICNRFSCEPLARLEAAERATQGAVAVLIVRRRQDHWRRADPYVDNSMNAGAVMEADGLRRLPPHRLSARRDSNA